MAYTKPVVNGSSIVTLTGVAQTLKQLAAAASPPFVIDKKTNEIRLSPIDDPTGVNPLAWHSTDSAHVPAPNNGEQYFGIGSLTITLSQFKDDGFSIVKHSGADKEMFLSQFDSEAYKT